MRYYHYSASSLDRMGYTGGVNAYGARSALAVHNYTQLASDNYSTNSSCFRWLCHSSLIVPICLQNTPLRFFSLRLFQTVSRLIVTAENSRCPCYSRIP